MTRGADCHSRLHGFAMTKRFVILSAERERIRNTLKRENGLPQPFTRLRNDGGGGLPRTLRWSLLPAR